MKPSDWCWNTTVDCYKGKWGILERSSYRGVELDQIMKVMESDSITNLKQSGTRWHTVWFCAQNRSLRCNLIKATVGEILDCESYMWRSSKKVNINNDLYDKFYVKAGIHLSSVLSSFLFIIVLQAITEVFKIGSSWELLHADDLNFTAKSIWNLEKKFQTWTLYLKSRDFKVGLAMTKVFQLWPSCFCYTMYFG